MSTDKGQSDKRLAANLNRFIWFRILFNARYYYPVFTVLYLDYGLTLEQFAILNVAWALTIVVAEVPSGALADILGRKPLIISAAVLMFIEMGLLVWIPVGSVLLFPVFLLNRICSGLAEAAASGADEALAYDSLKALGRESEWSAFLERAARWVSVAFFFTMITGALVYDPDIIHQIQGAIGIEPLLTENTIIKLPIILSWIHASALLLIVIGLKEPEQQKTKQRRSLSNQLSRPFVQILEAARWTLSHRFVLFVIIAALAIDSVARQFVVLASEYYRIISIPTAWFGFIGAGMALLGMLTAKVSRCLVTHRSPIFNFAALSTALLFGLVGISFTVKYGGVFFAIPVFAMMGMVQYLSSFYINRDVDSSYRATVLSFRGLALNLGLGVASLLYTGWIALLKNQTQILSEQNDLDGVFARSLNAFPFYYIMLAVLILVAGRILIRRKGLLFKAPAQDHAPSRIDSGNDH